MGSAPLLIHPEVVVFDEQPRLEIRVGRLYLLYSECLTCLGGVWTALPVEQVPYGLILAWCDLERRKVIQ
jgi:hypothetical protein